MIATYNRELDTVETIHIKKGLISGEQCQISPGAELLGKSPRFLETN